MAHHLNAPQVMYPDMVLNTSQMNSERTGTPPEFQARHSSTLYNSHVHCTYCCGLLRLRGSTAAPGLRAATLDTHKQVSHPFCTTCEDLQRPRVRMAIQRNLDLTTPTREDHQPRIQALTGNSEQDVEHLIQSWTRPTKATIEGTLGFHPRYAYGCITSLVLTGGRTADYFASNRRNYPENTKVAYNDTSGRFEPYSLSEHLAHYQNEDIRRAITRCAYCPITRALFCYDFIFPDPDSTVNTDDEDEPQDSDNDPSEPDEDDDDMQLDDDMYSEDGTSDYYRESRGLNVYRGTTTVRKGPPPQEFLMSYADYLAIHHGDTYGTRAYQTSPDRSSNSRRDYWTRVIQSFYFKYHDLSKLYRGQPFHDNYEWLARSSWQTTAGLDITTIYSGSGHNARPSPIMYTSTLANYIHALESGQWETISIASDDITIDSTSTDHADNNDVITIDSTSTDHPDTLDQIVGLLSEVAQQLNRVRQISNVLNQLRGIVDTIDQDGITQIARVLSEMSQQGNDQANRTLEGDQPRTAN